MPSYIAIANSEIDPDSPITADLLTKFRDNPLAIFTGDASVPSTLRVDGVNIQAFTASGTYTPTSGYKWALAFVTGGGGGGNSGSFAGGGGAGGTSIGVLNLSTIGTPSVTIGAGGSANNNGGATTVSVLTGGGGSGGNPTAGGVGGSGSGGAFNVQGGSGQYIAGSNAPGIGGGSFWGGGNNSSGRAYGAGGGGSGGSGKDGVVMIVEFRS